MRKPCSPTLYTKNSDEKNIERASVMGTEVKTNALLILNSSVEIHSRLSAQFETGYHASTFSKRFAPKNTLNLHEGFILWKATPFFESRFGIQTHQSSFSRLLWSDNSFLSLGEIFSSQWKNIEFKLSFYQSLAWSKETETNISQEQTPKFFHESLEIKSDALQFRFTHFLFSSLSHQMAYQSGTLGNSVSLISQETSTFLRDFQGVELFLTSQFQIFDSWKLGPYFSWAKNTTFAASASEAFQLGLIQQINISNHFESSVDFYYFTIGSDVFQALYISKQLGSSNRTGFGIKSRLAWNEKYFAELGANFSSPQQENFYQNKFVFVFAQLGGSFDLL